jgi:hypothetical protein
MHGGLHCRSANPSQGRDLFDRKIANPVTLDLECDDAENRPLAFGVMVPEVVRQRAGAAERPPPIARSFSVG